MRLIASLFLLLIVMPVTAGGDETYPADWFWGDKARRAKHDALIGKPAPALAIKNAGGKTVELTGTEGKVVVVDFWATWCGPCRAALPENVELMKEYADDGLLIVGIHDSKRGADKMPDLAKQYALNYPLYVDRGASQTDWQDNGQ